MDSCGCGDDFASIFDRGTAERDRERYRRDGPDRTTAMLLDMIMGDRVRGASLLDIGGGIGVITHELLTAGAGHAVLVDAAPAYVEVARSELRVRNFLDRVEIVEGDFVRRAASCSLGVDVLGGREKCWPENPPRAASLWRGILRIDATGGRLDTPEGARSRSPTRRPDSTESHWWTVRAIMVYAIAHDPATCDGAGADASEK